MSRLEEVLNLVKYLPPFPKVAKQVMTMVDDPAVTAQGLAEVIQFDPSITANVLKICNASYFGLPRKVSSLDEALVVIGQDILKDIIITSSSARFYQGPTGEGYWLEQGELWKHSVVTAIMSKMLTRNFKEVKKGTAFTTGLLHDIGKKFLSSFVSDEFKKIMVKVLKEKSSWVEAEKDILGITHAELGGVILEKWDFASEMITAVKQHHDPDALEKDDLTALVSLGNILVISMGIGGGADGLATKFQGEFIKRFGMRSNELDMLMVELLAQMKQAEEVLQLG